MDLETFEEEVNRSPFVEGQDYSSLKALKLAVQMWAIKEIFEFKTLRATKTRWEVSCKGENCDWRIYTTSISGAGNIFHIKKYVWKHRWAAINHSGHLSYHTNLLNFQHVNSPLLSLNISIS